MEDAALVRIDERGYIHIVASGVLTDDIARECSREVRSTPEFQAGMPLLIDLSQTTSFKISTDEVVSLAHGAQKDDNRVALVASDATAFGMARMYEMIADLTEVRVSVFRDFSQALNWLGV